MCYSVYFLFLLLVTCIVHLIPLRVFLQAICTHLVLCYAKFYELESLYGLKRGLTIFMVDPDNNHENNYAPSSDGG
jgi:hypothetical protein